MQKSGCGPLRQLSDTIQIKNKTIRESSRLRTRKHNTLTPSKPDTRLSGFSNLLFVLLGERGIA